MMKNLIRKILKETINDSELNKFEIGVLKMLHDQNFNNKTARSVIINFLKKSVALSGIKSYEIYELFKNNYNDMGDYSSLMDPLRVDVRKKRYSTPNNSGREMVTNRIPFKGSNTKGEYIGNSYVVSSYDWYPIFVWKDNQWYENKDKYSMSTSKQTTQLRPNNENIIKVSAKELRELI